MPIKKYYGEYCTIGDICCKKNVACKTAKPVQQFLELGYFLGRQAGSKRYNINIYVLS